MTDVALPIGGFARFDFSTDRYPARQRVAAWREEFGHTLLRIDLAPRSPELFRAKATAYRGANFGLLRASTSAVNQKNSRELIIKDDVTFGVITNARWSASQFGRSADLQAGDGAMMNNGEVGAITLPHACRYLAFTLAQSAIRPLVPDLDAQFARRVPSSSPALRMLMRYLQMVGSEPIVATPELQAAFTDHVCDLVALTLGATRDATEIAKGRGLRAARLHAIKADIARGLQVDMSGKGIAAAHGISERYLQRLFEEDGTTLTTFVLDARLELAHRLLSDPAQAVRSVSAIAVDAGFNDISYFNRRFRSRYGCTPSDVRRASRNGA
ncbi:helix-turn-helix domain-containing protein [Mesorhizobium sp. VK22B]|uniref:Helix-turn-helix domain-containing protein n=1 Tax=Mesorhizobium captivum TaxID=3072319 RepID=A0ABU4Z1C1_9HYPH|nr:helix-turn-helix domain-containing protein [Mesorhizobium sp. VK22B]MDX8493022.1 helix-turn-helix domain-containing protein [Mesorhizobium sp. VK22B]